MVSIQLIQKLINSKKYDHITYLDVLMKIYILWIKTAITLCKKIMELICVSLICKKMVTLQKHVMGHQLEQLSQKEENKNVRIDFRRIA